MKLEDHVLKAIEAFDRNEKDHALMHATFAIEGTAKNLFSKKILREDYKNCIRQYWWVIERFIGEGLNLEETKFTHLNLIDEKQRAISNPDLADVIYHIFRCHHAHAEEIPINYKLLPTKDGHHSWEINILNNGLLMPETIIWSLLAVAVFSKANVGIKTTGEHYLTWGSEEVGITTFIIKDCWGKEDLLKEFFSDKPQIRVKLENL
ncbi:MAG: hypothetical protein ACYCQI_15390 [Gammaproteobacteria bacterium]